jgi:hypothetical protein
VALTLNAAEALSAAGHPFRAQSLLAERLAFLPDDAETADRLWLLHEAATVEVTIALYGAAYRHATEALALTDDTQANEGRARSLALLARTALEVDHDEEASRSAMEALAQARELRLVETEAGARETLARIGQRAGAPEEAERWLIEAVERGYVGWHRRHRGRVAGQDDPRVPVLRPRSRRRGHRAVAGHGAARRRGRHAVVGARHGRPGAADVGRVQPRELGRSGAGGFGRRRVTAALRGGGAGRGGHLGDGRSRAGQAAPAAAAAAHVVAQGRVDPDQHRHAAMEMLQLSGDSIAALDIRDEIAASVAASWGNPLFLAQIRLAAVAVGVAAKASRDWSEAERKAAVKRLGPVVAKATEAAHGWVSADAVRPLGPEGVAWLDRLRAEWLRLRLLADVDPPTPKELIAAWRVALDSATADNMAFEQARCQARLGAFLLAAGRRRRLASSLTQRG